MPLNHTRIEALKPKDKPYKVADERGLSLYIQPNGSKWWRFRYRVDGHEKTISLGTYPDISLAQARERREEARKQLAVGIDPSAKRQEDKQEKEIVDSHTFEVWVEKWYQHWADGKTDGHARQTLLRLQQNVLPIIGKKPISGISSDDIADIVRVVANRGALDLATRAYQTISMVFRYAIAHSKESRCRANPAAFMRPSDIIASHKKQNYARVDVTELPQLLMDIDNSATTPITRIAIKLMSLTFVRTSELIESAWAEFDLEARQWRIPASRMKMKTPHIVPLSRQAIALLSVLKDFSGHTPLLFPNHNDHSRSMSNNTILKALERMGYKGRMTGHGFRGIASTSLHEQGFDHQHIELQLAHSERNEVSAAYNHALYLPQRSLMMQAWADYLDKLRL